MTLAANFTLYYDGHSINKLKNHIFLLISKIRKIQDMCFVGILFLSFGCEFCYDDITVTSFINIKYGDDTVENIQK